MRKKINMVLVPKLKKLIQGTGTKIIQLKKAFTLVELIVVITILAILATVGFVSFSGYLAGTRDVNRISQLKSMSDALELYRTKKDLPLPDDKVDIKVGTGSNEKTIAYQGYIGKNVLETIEYTESGLDPKDKNYFSYYLTKNKKYFQLLAFLEEPSEDVVAINNKRLVLGTKNIALKTGLREIDATDYSERYPKTTGKKLGILTDENNTPIQEIPAITGSGYLDLNNVGTTVYKTIIANDEIISGSGTTLAGTHMEGNCKRIKQIKGSSDDGFYTIDPEGDGVGFKVYCDMTTDGGGWTLYLNRLGLTSWNNGNSGGGVSNYTDLVSKCSNIGLKVFADYTSAKNDYWNVAINYLSSQTDYYTNNSHDGGGISLGLKWTGSKWVNLEGGDTSLIPNISGDNCNSDLQLCGLWDEFDNGGHAPEDFAFINRSDGVLCGGRY